MILDPSVTVICDICRKKEAFYLGLDSAEKETWETRSLSRKMEARGWITHPDGKTFCSDECAVKYAADT